MPGIKIEISTAEAQRHLKQLEKELGRTGDGTTRATKKVKGLTASLGGLSKVVGVLGGAYGLSRLAKSALNTAASFEQMELKLNALTKGKGTETLAKINKWALDMPVNTKKAVDSFVMMQAMGLDPTIEKMQKLVNVSSIFGEEAMPRIARALGQMKTLGKLSAEEMNQMAEVGINARKYIKDSLGMTVQEFQKSGLKIEKAIEAIWKGFDADYSGAAKAAMNSWQGVTATFESYVVEIQRTFMDAGIFTMLKDQIKLVNEATKEWLVTNKEMIKQDVPKYLEAIKVAMSVIVKIYQGWKLIIINIQYTFAELVKLIAYGMKQILGPIQKLLDKAGMKSWADSLAGTMTTLGIVFDVAQTEMDKLNKEQNELIAKMNKSAKSTDKQTAAIDKQTASIKKHVAASTGPRRGKSFLTAGATLIPGATNFADTAAGSLSKGTLGLDVEFAHVSDNLVYQTEETTEEISAVWSSMNTALADSFETGFANLFIDGMNDMGSFFKDWGQMLVSSFQRSVAQMITDWLFFDTIVKNGETTKVAGGAIMKGLSFIASSVFHDGGVVGGPAPTRNVSPSVFAGAKRYHNGLASDEFPAILQKGETVIPKGETVIPKGGTSSGVVVNIINQGPDVEVERSQPRFDQGQWVMDILLKQKRKGTPAARQLFAGA